MRLWHQSLIPYLDNKRLLSQHRECCALRGKGWGKKHSVVDYVFKYDRSHLYQYHLLVMREMVERKYSPSLEWFSRVYRGEHLPADSLTEAGIYVHHDDEMIYAEHNDSYLKECLLNLKSKGAKLINGMTIEKLLISFDLND